MTSYILLMLLALAAVVTAATIWGVRRHRLNRYRRQAVGLQWLQSMKRFLSHIQQHRGMSNGYLNGRDELLHDLEFLQLKITSDLGVIVGTDDWLQNNERWQSICDHWSRLSCTFRRNNAENNLAQHNALIASILYLMDDMAQEHDLLLLSLPQGKPLYLLWRQLLAAAEFVGQTRAIGMGVAVRGECDSVARIRLNYLCQKISDNTGSFWDEIPVDEYQRQGLEDFIACIGQHLVSDRVSIAPTDFFQSASKVLDDLYAQYDSLLAINAESITADLYCA